MRVLDVGCCPNKTEGAIGVDLNPNLSADIIWDINKMPFPIKDNSIDRIVCSHVIEHLKTDLNRVMREFHRMLKPNGTVLIRTPHFSHVSAWDSYDHIRPFGLGSWDFLCHDGVRYSHDMYYTKPLFQLLNKRLVYEISPKNWYAKLLFAPVQALADLSPRVCERYWCYLVGGFSEIRIELMALK